MLNDFTLNGIFIVKGLPRSHFDFSAQCSCFPPKISEYDECADEQIDKKRCGKNNSDAEEDDGKNEFKKLNG